MMKPERKLIDDWNGEQIAPGESRDIRLAVSESYSGMTVKIPLQVRRAKQPGPVVFVTAALHGDEINGTGAIRQLIQDSELVLERGAVIFVPVLNVLSFDRHSRYLPDRRDLNRCFPGALTGSMASRFAHRIFSEIALRSDFGIDLHTAAVRRTNYPNIRGDLRNPAVRRLAQSFGCELIIDGKGPRGSFRREACRVGVPTITFEGGEVWKVERGIVESITRGVKNVLAELEMIDQPPEKPNYQVLIETTKWMRAERGGFLHFHVQPGQVVERDSPLATNTNLLGRERDVIRSPWNAIVLGMTTLPAISPGEPICHLGKLPADQNPAQIRELRRDVLALEQRMVDDLGANMLVVDPPV